MANRATTWATLRDGGPGHFFQTLVEIEVRYIFNGFTGAWAQHGVYTNTYYQTVTQRLNQHNRIYPTDGSALADGVALTQRASIADVNSNAGSYYFDTATSIFYVRLNPTANPDALGHLVSFDFWLCYSWGGEVPGQAVTFASGAPTGGVSGLDYRPLLSSAPIITRETPELYSGVPIMAGSRIELYNPKAMAITASEAAIFDDITELYEWINADVRILFGGDDLPYSEYQVLWTGVASGVEWSDDSLVLEVEDIGRFDAPPVQTTVSLSNYPNAHPTALGRVLPILYGAVREVTALLTNTTTLTFTFCKHACVLVERVDVVGFGEVIPQSINLTTGTFILPEFMRSFVVDQQSQVTAWVIGTKDANGDPMTNPADVVKDLFDTHFSTAYNAASFTLARRQTAAMHVALAIVEPQPMREILDRLCRTMVAFITPNGSGEMVLEIPQPQRADVTADRRLFEDRGDLFDLTLSWRRNRTAGGYIIETAPESSSRSVDSVLNDAPAYIYADTSGQQRHRNTNYKQLETALENGDVALIVSERARQFYGAAVAQGEVTVSHRWYDLQPNDLLWLWRTRGPDAQAAGWSNGKRFRLLSLSMRPGDDIPTGTAIIELIDGWAGTNIGKWKAAGSNNWAASSAGERTAGGYWTDDSGRADAAADTSYGYSLWT